MDDAKAARLIGVELDDYRAAIAELEAVSVFSRTDGGTIFSRRMVADEHLRNVRAETGKLGGNPKLLNREDKVEVKQTDKQMPTPSSSSSSSKEIKPIASADQPPGFVEFWKAYPATRRRVAKAKCLSVWRRQGCESVAERIVMNVVAMCGTKQWRDGYEPAPLKYLTERRWEDGLPASARPDLRLAL